MKTLLGQIEAAWQAVLDVIPATVVDVDSVTDAVPHLMGEHGLPPMTLFIVATAAHAGTRAIVTIDAGFAATPATLIDLYVDSSRVTSCRKRRS